MSSQSLTLAAAATGWLAITTLVAAQPVTTADTPTGDVWVTPDAPRATPPVTAQNAPGRRVLPTGDFWPTNEGATRIADTPAPPKDALAREEAAAAKMK
jgi:hypothetical protein